MFDNPHHQAHYSNPRVKKWVTTLLEHRGALERAAGGELGVILGCGHWGCVVDMPDTPWVLKLTIDPTEAHVWSKILELIKEEHYGDDGFPRIKKVFKLEPGIAYGSQGRRHTAYGIVREKVMPVFSGLGATQTPFTQQQLQTPHVREEFNDTIQALQKYRSEAVYWHDGARTFDPWRNTYVTREQRTERIERAIYRMSGSVGGPLGESLSMLLANDVVLNDVHLGNIGWRFLTEVEGMDGYTCLVIFDPGHTPTAKRELPAEQWQQLYQMG